MTDRTLAERVGLYSLLRVLYTYPLTESLLAEVAGLSLPPSSPLYEDLLKLQASTDVEQLNVEMTRLFEGPGQTPAPPYASYYLHNKQLMGPAAVRAQHTYLLWQAWPESEQRVPADHIALELGFMAYLAEVALQSEADRAKALAASYQFLTDHIMPWLPHFGRAVTRSSEISFFDDLVRFTQTAVHSDLEWLAAFQNANPQSASSGQTPNHGG